MSLSQVQSDQIFITSFETVQSLGYRAHDLVLDRQEDFRVKASMLQPSWQRH